MAGLSLAPRVLDVSIQTVLSAQSERHCETRVLSGALRSARKPLCMDSAFVAEIEIMFPKLTAYCAISDATLIADALY